MKTAISLPDELGSIIEKFIQKSHLSRSEFFQLAAKEYLDKRASQDITQNLDIVYAENTTPTDLQFLNAAAKHWGNVSKDEEW